MARKKAHKRHQNLSKEEIENMVETLKMSLRRWKAKSCWI